jgi:hypothetical protein
MDENQAAEQRAREKEKADSFGKWVDQSVMKLMISMLPPLETDTQRECFATLMRATFDAGYETGASTTAGTLIKAMFERSSRDQPRR